ncbi:glutamine synthetase family protein [Mycolicibacterium rufum]|uniref:Glutamine synthetase family protein n=1 Tax=Mycolicibacterium rufum TaxID=318424 RepID=A0ABY3UGG3_9MYCO|nr:glutamine synthetase family protein [Mycolicibacterium rufum]KGI66484.1 glutamate--ammonia ligase [Mycolicibacterium rufum]ULP37251.1 glutamine synthetase family protein [Mycolicibacterium rufum]
MSGALGARTAAEVLAHLHAHDIGTVVIGGSDTHGVMRGKRMPIEQLPRILNHGMPVCDVFWVMHVDESDLVARPDGHRGYFPTETEGYPDILGVPDLGTLRVVPWHHRTALLLCDWALHDGHGPVPISPRAVLRRVVERATDLGYQPLSALELEFYLLREKAGTAHRKRAEELVPLQEVPSTYGVVMGSLQEEIGELIRGHMLGYGLPVEACNPETGPGQFEITLRYGESLRAADDAFLFKSAIKEVAAQQDLLATFMAKPSSDWAGNSCHIHMSLRDTDGAALFFDREAPDQLSNTLRHFTGGILASMREFTALMAPTPNSYRRYVPYSWAGTTTTWGVENRSVGVRIIRDGESGTRLEHRQPGGDANPYLATAAALAGGLHGLAQEIDPGEMTVGDVYGAPPGRHTGLPTTLGEALDLLEDSAVAREWFGDDFVEHFVAMKRAELQAQSLAVTDWEVARYLESI